MKMACGMWLALMGMGLAAGLDFPNPLQEIHAAADARKVTADFEFTNRSNKPVLISKYDSTCSCMGVKIQDGKLRYAPGESGVVRAEFTIGNFSGTMDKVVALWLDKDAADKPSVSLTIRVHIPVLVELDPKTLKWDLSSKVEPKTIRITMHHEQAIRVLDVTSTSEAFQHELKTLEEGKRYELIVTPVSMTTPALGIFRIETDCKLERHRIQQVFATVRKPRAASPAAKP
jgi:hypothetical protein